MMQRYSNAMRLCAGTALLAMLAGCAASAPTLAPGTSDKVQTPNLSVQTGKAAKVKMDEGPVMGQDGAKDMGYQSCDGQMPKLSDKPRHEGQSPPMEQGLSTQPEPGQQNVLEQAQLPISQSDVSQSTEQDLSQGQLPASSTDLSQGQTSSSVDLGAQGQPPTDQGTSQSATDGSCPPPDATQPTEQPKEQSAPSQPGNEGQPMDQSQMSTSPQGY